MGHEPNGGGDEAKSEGEEMGEGGDEELGEEGSGTEGSRR